MLPYSLVVNIAELLAFWELQVAVDFNYANTPHPHPST